MVRRGALHPASLGASIAFAAVILGSVAGCASMAPADPEAIAERAAATGISADLVYTTTVDGYDLAPQSVGETPSGGMSASWVNTATGGILTIRTEHGEITAASCPDIPLWDGGNEPVACTDEGGRWHRTSGSTHEYIVARDDTLILVTGMNNADPGDLLAAAQAVHVPSAAELELLFSDLPDGPAEPVQRGDIPENGDGAPIDPTGPGG